MSIIKRKAFVIVCIWSNALGALLSSHNKVAIMVYVVPGRVDSPGRCIITITLMYKVKFLLDHEQNILAEPSFVIEPCPSLRSKSTLIQSDVVAFRRICI